MLKCSCTTPQNHKHLSTTPLISTKHHFHIIVIWMGLLWIWNWKRDTSNMKAWQLLHEGSLGSKGQPQTKQMEKLFMAMQNSQKHHQHRQPIPICILFQVRKGPQIQAGRIPWAHSARGGGNFWTHLLNFAFSIRYFLRVHEGVEYPLQEKPERMCERLFCHKCHSRAAPKGGWVRKWGQSRIWALPVPGFPKGIVSPCGDLHGEADLEGKEQQGFIFPDICLFTKLT